MEIWLCLFFVGLHGIRIHTEKYYSKNSYLGPEEMPLNKNPVGSTVFHANFIASVADTARIFYLK